MKVLVKLFLAILLLSFITCSKTESKKEHHTGGYFPARYENELFSISMPLGWECDDSQWGGLDCMQNIIEVYDPYNDMMNFHIVKTFMPIQCESITEVTEMAKLARFLSGDSVELIEEIDSVQVGGYPASVLIFANFVGNDTIIQKQYVSYLNDSHIVVYVNEIFTLQSWGQAQLVADKILGTLKFKKVINPLDDDTVFMHALNEGMKNPPFDERYIDKVQRIIDESD